MSEFEPVRPRAALVAAILSANDSRIAKQAAALRDAGWDVDLLSWQSDVGKYPSLPGARLLDYQRPFPKSAFRWLPHSIENLARAALQRRTMQNALVVGRYNAVISSDPETLRPCAKAKTKGGFGLVYDAHEYFPDEVPNDPARSRWVKRVHGEAGHSVDAFITVNEAIADLYLKSASELGSPIVVKNASPLRPKVIDDGRLRQLAGADDASRILLFQGGLARDRGLFALVEAMDIAPAGWILVIMGSGPLENELRAKAGKKVKFIAPQKWDELHLWTAGADLGAILYEGTCANQRLCSPNKLWEYPSAGLPILASDLPYLGKIVRDNQIGFVVSEPVTAQSIQATLASLTPDRLSQASAAVARFSEASTWESQALRFVEAVTSAAKGDLLDQPTPGLL
jgi:glycosyltransferase involved in cell wall biosynthesis